MLRFLSFIALKAPKRDRKLLRAAARAFIQAFSLTINLIRFRDTPSLYPEAVQAPISLPDDKQVSVDTDGLTTYNVLAVDAGNNALAPSAAQSGRNDRLKGATSAAGRKPFAIVSGLFGDEREIRDAVDCRVRCIAYDKENVDEGEIERPLGKAGKVRVESGGCVGTSANVGDHVELYDTRWTLLMQR